MEQKETSGHLRSISTVAVIGAGPAGLAAAWRLVEDKINVTVLERKCQAGGTWVYETRKPLRPTFPTPRYDFAPSTTSTSRPFSDPESYESDAPPGACYESLMNNIITPLMKFPQYEYPPNTGWFVTHDVIREYLQRFSQETGLDRLTKYNSNVLRVDKVSNGKWIVTSREIMPDPKTHRVTSIMNKDLFDAVIVCTGHYERPFVPFIPGLDGWVSEWPEHILHSKEYRDNDQFQNKTILIIGAGNSAYDIGREVASVARRVYQTVRSRCDDSSSRAETPWEKVVRSIIPDNLLQVPEIAAFCSTRTVKRLQDADILLVNGARLSGVDFVIFCTGYRYSLPFLPSHQAEHTQKAVERSSIISDGEQLYNLHKDMFFIEDWTLAFVGVSKEIATFSFFDMQSVAIAAVFSGRVSLPSPRQMWDEYEQRKEKYGTGTKFHILGLRREIEYMREILDWVNGPSAPRVVTGYEKTLCEAQQKQSQALRELLTCTKILWGKSREEKQEIIVEKTKQLQDAIAIAGRVRLAAKVE